MRDSRQVLDDFLTNAAEIELLVQEKTGLMIRGLKVLDVGCGQQLKLAQYFALKDNFVVGIDYNVVPWGFDPYGYWSILRENGLMRLMKTLGRKALGIDSRFARDLRHRFSENSAHQITTLQMNAEKMRFADSTFDFVYTRSVFEHLEHPGRTLREIRRVMKPGAVAHLGLHLYTCDSGAHDPRVLSGDRAEVPMWAHLRAAHAASVQPNSYLNRYQLEHWRRLFAEELPGAYVYLHKRGEQEQRAPLERLRAAGELDGYTDDELLTDEVVAIWKKPTD